MYLQQFTSFPGSQEEVDVEVEVWTGNNLKNTRKASINTQSNDQRMSWDV